MLQQTNFLVTIPDHWTRNIDATGHAENIHPYSIAMSPEPNHTFVSMDYQQQSYQLTPLSSPSLDVHLKNKGAQPINFISDMTTSYLSQMATVNAISALQAPPHSQRSSMDGWGTNALPYLGFPNSEVQNEGNVAAGWWTALSVATPVSPSLVDPFESATLHSTNHDISFNTNAMMELGITCDTTGLWQYTPKVPAAVASLIPSTSSYDFSPYAPICPTAAGTTIGTHPANPPSRSPSHSPQPRFMRRRDSQIPQALVTHQRASQHRRKSSNTSTSATSLRKNSSSTATGGFVNFTPSDSKKILTGVAPSGSSKTKARREKEAADKRRKLSQAAIKAVVDAGGNLRGLEEEGLLNLET